jgi:hypothetical protein
MATFKSPQDLNKLSTADPAHPVVKELVDVLINAYTWPGHLYLPEDYGYVVLIEESDADRILTEIWDDWKLLDISRESISRLKKAILIRSDFLNDRFIASLCENVK